MTIYSTKLPRSLVAIRDCLLCAIGLLLPNFGDAADFTSTARQVNLVELFTSEGCSSCPPAEGWFSKLKQEPGLWTDFVPVAFHVDYWDTIGWTDRFASPTNSNYGIAEVEMDASVQ